MIQPISRTIPLLPRHRSWRFAATAIAFACLLAAASPVQADAIDINSASAEELAAAISGVGLKKANAIVADRESNGPFLSVDDLERVRGIGPATVEANRDRLTIGNPAADPAASAPPADSE